MTSIKPWDTWLFAAAIRLCGVVAVVAACGDATLADDAVTLRTSGGSVVVRRGTVVDYTASELRLQPAGGPEVVVPADQIVKIETPRSTAHADADAMLDQRKWKDAAGRFADAIRGEDRPWVRREMLAQMTRCYREIGDGDAAGKVFLQLAKGNPTAGQFAAMPLAWQVDETFVVSPPQARAWLDAADDSAANLLGASHLLTTADAMTALARLTNDRDVRIAMLAEAQRWRTVRIGLDDKELARRRNVVEKIALPLRSGPYYVLGQSLLAAGRTDEGVAALMRVPIELADRRSLAAAALSDAAAALKAAGRHDEASAIARELEQRYRDETGSRRGGTIRLPLEPGQPRK